MKDRRTEDENPKQSPINSIDKINRGIEFMLRKKVIPKPKHILLIEKTFRFFGKTFNFKLEFSLISNSQSKE